MEVPVGNATVNASLLSDAQLACDSPPQSGAAVPLPLEVSVDARNYTADKVAFAYHSELDVVALVPTEVQWAARRM